MTLVAAAFCIVYVGLLPYGAWRYGSPFVGEQVCYEVNGIRMPGWLRFIEPLMNDGEPYESGPASPATLARDPPTFMAPS